MVIRNKSFDINRLDSYDRTILKERAKKELREYESYLMIATLMFMLATIIIASLFYNKDDNLGVAIIKDFVSAILVGTFSMSCYTFMQAYHNKTVDQFIKDNSSFNLFWFIVFSFFILSSKSLMLLSSRKKFLCGISSSIFILFCCFLSF